MLGDDSLFILLSAIFIWLLLRLLRGDDRWGMYAVLGLGLGLSIATKYSTGLLPLVVIFVVWWRARQNQWGWLQPAGRLAVAWLFTLLGSSWWFGWLGYYFNSIKENGLVLGLLSSVLTTGPDVSMRRVFAFFGSEAFSGSIRPGAVAAGNFGQWLTYLFQTFWGVPVLEDDSFFPWAYLLMLLFCLLALVGLWSGWRNADAEARAALGALALIVVLLIPFPLLRYFLTFNILETGQGRHILYPAAQSIPILLMVGWFTFFKHPFIPRRVDLASRPEGHSLWDRLRHVGLPVLGNTQYALFIPVLLLIWGIFQLNIMTNTYPVPLPVQTTTFKATSIPQPLKHNFGEAIQFLGYDFQPDPDQAIINLTLYWRALKSVDENYRTQVQLVDPAGRPRFTWLSHPLNGLYPTRAWDKGDVIRDTLPLPLAAIPANTYNIQISLLHEAEDTSITDQPFQFIQFDLGKVQPIANASKLTDQIEYRLWVDDNPVRHRQTLPLSWKAIGAHSIQNPNWVLLGPDNVPRSPIISGEATAMFVVGAEWPSGDYRLGLVNENVETEPLLTIANDVRLFDLPPWQEGLDGGYIPVEANFADQIKLFGYSLTTRRVHPGGEISLDLIWQSLAPVLPDAVTFAVLLDAGQQPYGSIDRYPHGFYSPILWTEGEVVADSFTIPVPPEAPPGIYYLHVGQYQLVDDQPESLSLFHEGNPTDNTAVVIGPFKVGGPPPGATVQNPAPQVSLNQPLGDQITLIGYDLTDSNNRPIPVASTSSARNLNNAEGSLPPSSLQLTLYWQAHADIQTDYTTFFHLRNTANETVIQKDSPPVAGRYPTSLWNAGEIIVDQITLSLEQISAGEYTPVVGLYQFSTGVRLPVPGIPANEVALQPFLLKE
jgi:hypothetical protein